MTNSLYSTPRAARGSYRVKAQVLLLLALVILGVGNLYAQPVTGYTRTVLTGVGYTPVTGGGITVINSSAGLTAGVMTGNQDDGAAIVTLPFYFPYCGNAYNQVTFCTNGWVGMGAQTAVTAAESRAAGNLFSATAPRNTIGAWMKDMGGNFPATQPGTGPGEMRHGLIGTETYAFEWSQAVGSSFSITTTNLITFQVVIYGYGSPFPGRFEMIYGATAGTTAFAAAIGFENATGGSGNFINALDGTSTSTTTASAWPGNGNGYRFDPPCTSPGATFTVAQDCGNGQYFVDVTIVSLGGSATIDITGAPAAPITGITTPGTYPMGPYASGTSNTISVVPGDPVCTVSQVVAFTCPLVISSYPYCQTYNSWTVCNSVTSCSAITCTLPATDGWVNDVTESPAGDWYVNFGTGGSAGTGPSAGDNPNGPSIGTGNYLQIEAGSCTGRVIRAISPSFDVSSFTGNARASLWYHMWDNTTATDNMGSLALQVEDPTLSGNWVTLWSRSGNAGNNWFQSPNIDYAPTGDQIRYRLVGTVGSGFESDMAVDDFCLVEASCIVPTASGSVVPDCANNEFSISVNITSLGDATSLALVPSSGTPITGITTTGTYVLGPFSAAWPSGTTVSVTLQHNNANCNVSLGGFSSVCPLQVNAPYCDNFNSYVTSSCGTCNTNNTGLIPGGWSNGTPGRQWQTCNASTTSTNTGPDFDHTTGTGNYVYTEGTTCTGTGEHILLSPSIDISTLTQPYLEFWYHLFGANVDIQTLFVDVEDPALSGNWTNVTSLIGVAPGGLNQWQPFAGNVTATGPQIRFRYRVDIGTSFDSDMAIDDFCLSDAPTCISPSATFTRIDDCANEQFSVSVDVTSMGDATTLHLRSDLLGLEQSVTTTGTYLMGPYSASNPFQTVQLQVVHTGDSLHCSITDEETTECPCEGYTTAPGSAISSTIPTTNSVLTVGAVPGNLIDLDVVIDITHTYLADLDITLESPDGVIVSLMNDVCIGNDNMLIRFDDAAASQVVCSSPTTLPTIGRFQTSGTSATLLSLFNGGSFTGDWTLHVTDDAGGDDGTLNRWCLIPTLVNCDPPEALLSATPDCPGGTYTLDVDITSIGDATTVSIETDVNGIEVSGITAPGVHTIGPFPLGSTVNVTVNHDQNSMCDRILAPFTYDCQPTDFCGSYSASPAAAISDNLTTTSTISTGPLSGDAIVDLDVVIEITHTFLGDLDITLESPSGTIVNLMNDLCGGDDNMEIRFDDEASTAVVCSPVATSTTIGRFRTSGTLATLLGNFDAQLFEGTWTLRIFDDATGDSGTLVSWCLLPVLQIPDCPTPTGFAVTGLSENSVTVDWTPGAGNTGYSIEYGPSGFVPGTGTVVSGSGAGPVVISGLATGTAFQFYLTETCAAGSALTIGPVNATTLLLVTSFPYCQDIESFTQCPVTCSDPCGLPATSGWLQSASDDTDWLTDAGGTTSTTTGPSVDHTLGNTTGKYLYLESSVPCTSAEAVMTSPKFDVSSMVNDPIVSFWYHMCGATQGTLSVELESPAGSNAWITIYSRSGQDQTAETAPWKNVQVPLPTLSAPDFRLRFTGVAGGSFTSDMAIDDICVTEGPCQYPQASFNVVCGPGTSFNIEVTITDLGSGPLVDITNDVNPLLNILGVDGSANPYVMGPFTGLGTFADVTLSNPAIGGCTNTYYDFGCPPPNDDCASENPADVLIGPGSNVTLNGYASGSTIDPALSGVFSGTVQGIVWESFTVTTCVDLTVNFCGTTPTWGLVALNMYTDCSGTNPVNSQSFDFTTCGDGNPSVFYLSLNPGTYYYPVLWAPPTAQGFYTLHLVATAPVTPCTPNVCAQALPISCGQVVTGTTVSNTATQGASVCLPNHVAPGPDAWYAYTATGNDLVVASTCVGTTYNSMITVYEGAPDCSNLICVTGNDNNCGAGTGSEVNWLSSAGTTYYIAVHGPNGFVNSTGAFTLAVICQPACVPQPNDICSAAIPLTPVLDDGSGTFVTYDNTCAFADANPSCDITGIQAPRAQGVWFSFNSGTHEFFNLYLYDDDYGPYTAFDMSFAVYDGPDCANLNEVECHANGTGGVLIGPLAAGDHWILAYNIGGIGEEGTFGTLLTYSPANDAGITDVIYPDSLVCDLNIVPSVELTNFGVAPLTDVDITYSINGGPTQVFHWTGGPLNVGQTELVELPVIVSPSGFRTLTASTSLPNGVADEIPANDDASEDYDATGQPIVMLFVQNQFGSQLSWEVVENGLGNIVATGGPYSDLPAPGTQVHISNHCLPTTYGPCFSLFVHDLLGDGFCCGTGFGSWEIRTPDGRTVVKDDGQMTFDSPASPPASVSYANGHEFCLPLGEADIKSDECDVFINYPWDKVFCKAVPGALRYQFRFSDPNAGFARYIVVPNNWVRFNQMVSNPLVPGTIYFAAARADLGSLNDFSDDHFSGGCNLALDPNITYCTQLNPLPGPTFSCGVTVPFGGSSKIWAVPVPTATQYHFKFVNVGEGYQKTVTRTNYVCPLNWVTTPLVNGSTYDVTVEAYVGSSWQGYCGNTCTVTINNSLMGGQGNQNVAVVEQDGVKLWPNPVRDGNVSLLIEGLSDATQNITVDIFDAQGKLMLSKEYGNSGEVFNTVLELGSHIAAGTYQVNISVNGKTTTQRLSVQ